MSTMKIISLLSGCFTIGIVAAQLPSFTPCSRSLPTKELSKCVTEQARRVQSSFAKGLSELNLEPLDPLSLKDLSAKAGTFTIKCTNVVVKGLRKVDIRDINWNFQKNVGHTRIYGNMTFLCDYETEGQILLFPITGNGNLTVKMYDTEMLFKYKLKTIQGEDGSDHIQTYEYRPSTHYGNVKIHMSNLLGGAAIGDTINQVMNENWRELMAEVGPPFTVGISNKVHDIINQFYRGAPLDQLFAP